MPSYILAINCGSSSIKSKLFEIPSSKSEALKPVADATVKNIGSKGDKVKFKVEWSDGKDAKLGEDVEEEGDEGVSVECKQGIELPALRRANLGYRRQVTASSTARKACEIIVEGQERGHQSHRSPGVSRSLLIVLTMALNG